MKLNNPTLKCACSSLLIVGLMMAFAPRTAADGSGSISNYVVFGLKPNLSIVHQILPNAKNAPTLNTSTIPVKMTVPQVSIQAGESFTCSVSVSSVPPNGGYVQILCDTPGAVSNSSGSWPYSVYFAPGSSTTASFTLTANSVSGSTTVNLYFGSATADPNNPNDWTAGGAVTIVPGC